MNPESQAWRTLRPRIMEHCRPDRLTRIENGLAAGIPDTLLEWKYGRYCWLEGKHLKTLPKRNSTIVKLGLRPEQEDWFDRCDELRIPAIIWVRVPAGWVVVHRYGSVELSSLTRGDFGRLIAEGWISKGTCELSFFKTATEAAAEIAQIIL